MTATGGDQICIVGSINEDNTLRVSSLPAAGETILAKGRLRAGGGKGANQAAAIAAMGSAVAMVGAVGSDAAGDQALASLNSRGVNIEHIVRDPSTPTGSAMILVDDDSENVIVVDPGANATLDPHTVADSVGTLDPLITMGQLEIPLPALIAAARATKRGQFILNPAPMPDDAEQLEGLLRLADTVLPNRSELGRLASRATPQSLDEVDDCVAALGFDGNVVVTLGSSGAVVYASSGGRHLIDACQVDAVDTSGAGDVFCAVFAHRLAHGDELVDAAQAANRAAGISTTLQGAQVPADFATRLKSSRLQPTGAGPLPL